MLLLLFELISISNASILDYMSMPNKYSNCLSDYLTKEECQEVDGEWEEIERKDCKNIDFSSEKTNIGLCCNMKCLSGDGIIKILMENNKVCNYKNNTEDFYGFKDYTPFNNYFMEGVGYNENNKEYMTYKRLTEDKENILSLYCSFHKKEDLLIGLINIMNQKFDYVFGGGKKNGPTEIVKNETKFIGFDCNRLTMFLLDKVSEFKFDFGINAQSLYNQAEKNNLNKSSEDLNFGDAIFYYNLTGKNIYHSAIFIGNNKKFHAGQTGQKIKESNIFIPEDVIILGADFINIKKEKENSITSDTIEEKTISTTVYDLKAVRSDFCEKIKFNLFFLFVLIFFIQ